MRGLCICVLSIIVWFGSAASQAAPRPEDTGNPGGPAALVENLTRQGDRLFNAGQYEAATAEYQKALAAARERHLPQEECNLLNNLAAVFMAQGQHQSFHQAFAQARECQWRQEKAGPALPAARPSGGNLLVNGGFEEGLTHPWGTGHYESAQGKSRFGIWWNSMNALAFMKIDTGQSHSGKKSLRITSYSPPQPHVFTTTSQRITGLKPNTVYRLSLYAKAENLKRGVLVITDAAWGKRQVLAPAGTYDWKECRGAVNIGHNDYIDVRLVMEDTGAVWLDDLVVEEEQDPNSPEALLQKAESLYDRAQFREALEVCQDLERQHPDKKGLVLQAQYLIGRINLALGRYEEARRQFQGLAAAKFRPAPIALGDLYYQLGEFDKANDSYRQALDLFRGDQGTYSRIHEKLAASLLAQGKWDEALKAQRLALHVQTHIGDVHGQALVLNTTGLIFLQKKDAAQALKSFAAAGKLARQVNDNRLLTYALLNQAEALLRLQRLDEARSLAEEGVRQAKAMGETRTHLQALYLRGRLLRQTGQGDKALADFRQAVGLLQELYLHLGVTPRETRQAFLTQFADLYQDYIDLLLERYQKDPQPGYREEAFRRSEEARARLFTEMVSEARAAQAFAAATQNPELGRLVAKEREARLQLEALRRQQAHLREQQAAQRPPLTPPGGWEQKQAQALEELGRVQEEIRRRFPRYADLKNPQPLGFQEVQGLLQPDEAVVSYFITPRRTAVWAVNRESAALAVVPAGRQALRQKVRPFIEVFPRMAQSLAALGQTPQRDAAALKLQQETGSFDLQTAQALYQTLVSPVAPVLAGKRLIYLAPDDLLYQLPFEALLTGPPPKPAEGAEQAAGEMSAAPFWVKTQCLAYVPSVSVLRSLRTHAKDLPPAQQPLLAFADPVFDTDSKPSPPAASRQARLQMLRGTGAIQNVKLAPLPETAEEARRAAQSLGGRPEDLYLQLRATEHNLKKLPLTNFRTVLFATHGLMAGEFRRGLQPALALSFVGDPDNDGLLEMGEILGLDLRAHLVVLSACNTGLSTAAEDRGEGFAGLTRSFMYAGGESLVVTLWSVEGQSAAHLMGDFYAALPQKDRATALAGAKRAMLSRGGSLPLGSGAKLSLAHPFFWAPYVLVGEGR